MTNLFKDWKFPLVICVFIWSLLTLFSVCTKNEYENWQRLAQLSPFELRQDVYSRLVKRSDFAKLTSFQKEDFVKNMLDEANIANNIQVLGHYKHYLLYTNLKLGLDLRGGSQLLLQALPSKEVPQITPEVMQAVETVINNRINSLGVSETVVQRSGRDRLIVELPGIKDPQAAKDRIGTTAMLEFKELSFDSNKQPVWLDVGLTGSDFKHAQAVPTASASIWRVTFEFKQAGATKFAELTKRLVGRQIGIFLDGEPTERGPDGRPLSALEYHGVTVKEPILAGSGEITGNYSKDQAVDLAVKLNAGALPTPVKILEERSVGATLGKDSIHKSLIAGGVGLALVAVFMMVVYGVPGLIADIALILYTLTTLAIFKATPVTLTLAGIAGFILSIGMAVDANILIFERTKEEIRQGKNLYMAIENGFSKAFSSIFDSNMNSIIACLVLMLFGTSIVKGFAVTLLFGVLVSMFTAITATRALLHLVPRNVKHIFNAQEKNTNNAKVKEAV